ncbi:MAG: pyridoxal phosphate-dependent decarboxylase family protein [Candidatus Kapaibacteriales bacterium]
MDLKEFLPYAKEVLQLIYSYYQHIDSYPVSPNIQPGWVKGSLPSSPPEVGESFEKILQDFENIILPGITHWQHPRFFAYFPANTSFPSILAEFLTSALAPQCMMWATSPAATELEERVMDWLRQIIGLSNDFNGVIQDTASISTLVAIVVAREKASNFSVNRNGFDGKKYTVYCSTEAHSSIEKAVKIAGLGAKNLRKIPVDDKFALKSEVLRSTILQDIKDGFVPLAVVAAFGTTSSTAFDPLKDIGEIAQEFGLWYHIDGAMAGSALILPEFSEYRQWINMADSFVFNPHKWLFTNFDCSAFFIKDKNALLNTFSLSPEYLKTNLDEKVTNYRDWGIQLGRRFRALKLWFVIRSFGLEGLRNKIREHIQWAKELSEVIRNENGFEVVAPVNLNTICFRFIPKGILPKQADYLNQKLLESINKSGFAFLSHTSLNNQFVLRFSIGQTNTKREDIFETWKRIKNIARNLN